MGSILLWLEGPMQSWDADSRFSRRGAGRFPTKSGIIGMLMNAMGKRGEQRELLASLSQGRLDITAYRKDALAEPLLCDFHMIGAGYSRNLKIWESYMVPRNADGELPGAADGDRRNAGTVLTYRYYMQDMAFAAALEISNASLMEEAERCLRYPVYPMWLGRKCCLPSAKVYLGSYPSNEDALRAGKEHARGFTECFSVRELSGEDISTAGAELIRDVPISFGKVFEKGSRWIEVIR